MAKFLQKTPKKEKHGNLTFANNTMVNCTMKDGTYMQVKNLYGTLTFSNNTHNGVVVTHSPYV